MSLKSPQVLGVITARGGSKSIPRKNLKLFLGKPLVAWAIETLKESGVCDRIVVSTDDEEIAEVSLRYGGEAPFMRPAELAQDHTPTLPVLQHALLWLKDHDRYWPDCAILLEPTSVGKRPFHVRGVLDMFVSTGADSVITVAEVPSDWNPHWQLNLDNAGRISLFTGGGMKDVIRRRQDLPRTYACDSAVIAFRPELLFGEPPSFYGDDVRAYLTDWRYALDLDTPEDWEVAEGRVEKLLAYEIPSPGGTEEK